MPTVLLIRHGQASFGGADYDVLSEIGVRQAEIVAAALQARGVRAERVISGAYKRQLDTAAAYTSLTGSQLEVDERWNEYDGNLVLTHHSRSAARVDGEAASRHRLSNREFQVILDDAIEDWIATAHDSPSPQSWPDFSAGGNGALADLVAELDRGATALVFTSGGVIASICAALLGAESAFLPLNRTQVNTGITKVVSGAAGASLISINDHSHLEAIDRALITYR
jgi:broad specificity phosphatase PhoE